MFDLKFLKPEEASPADAVPAEVALTAAVGSVAPSVAPASPDDTGPVQDALDAIVDVWLASYARRPVIHAGLKLLRGTVDLTAPLIRAALASAGIKIVRV